MTKTQCRENAFLILFEASFREESLEELYGIAEEIGEIEIDKWVRELAAGVTEKAAELDEIIASLSPKRAVSRIARTNLILLRMAIYEMKYVTKTPVNVAISEAVNLAQIYTAEEDISFINGVLGAFAKSLPRQEQASEEA